ncbi:MAG TPA: cytochrome c-type biogenesis CcmF C-terminal domain-containing protein [Thermoanaerobaculia bacterium]|nr:cytochrome c-type biogenesis CcmF C-terminal domain-containing protein [Thermoanaerobaculia bacterium]
MNTATLGRILILASLLVSAAGAFVGFYAGRSRSAEGLKWARRCAYGFALLMGLATFVMEYALLTHDFSVSYVAHVGSRAVPTWVTIVSLWSSLEGSILFWGFVLAIYIAIATLFTKGKYEEYMPDAIGVWLATAAFFSFLIAAPASPFHLMNPVPPDGPGPNPLLQNHVLMAIHPPFLYLGYVGMTIPFGFACAALIRGKLGHALLKPLRESLMLPWIFQTFAIMLGGWWAYEVLGWGGYWAWDPVENASLLPWLTATAALHSAVVLERRRVLKGWTVTLVQATFLLVILGTFMTRSGVFNSVHSFTQSAIGPTILGFLAAALIFSIALLAMRIDLLEAEGRFEGATSREGMFLFNNLLFVLLTFTVLIGTVFPLVVEALNGKQMSVGRPYFDRMVVPVGAILLFLLGVGPALPWGRATREQLKRALLPPIAGAILFSGAGFALGVKSPWTLLTLAFGGYAAQVTIGQMFVPFVQRLKQGGSLGSAIVDAQLRRGRRRFGSYLVHAGAVVVIIAIAVSSSMRSTAEMVLHKGDSGPTAGGYALKFNGIEERTQPHRIETVALFDVTKNGKEVKKLEPRMNQYQGMREPIGTPDVYSTVAGDLYLSIANIDPAQQTVAINVIHTPMVMWIWVSVILMGLGGFIALIPPREPRIVLENVVAGGAAETA